MIIDINLDVITDDSFDEVKKLALEIKRGYKPGDSGKEQCPICLDDTAWFYLAKNNGHLHAACQNKCFTITE